MYKHNFVCLSESYLSSSAPDGLLEISRYTFIRVDHPNNMESDRVCILL